MIKNIFSLDSKEKYLLACSNGVDSTVALHIFLNLDFKIIVCHVDYQQRKESSLEIKNIRKICKSKDVPVENLVVSEKHSGNFQTWARKIRFLFFEEMAKKHNTQNIIIAHHENDYFESYLIKKERNVVNKSIALPIKSKYNNLIVYRPFLKVPKNEILQYAIKNKLPWVEDESNASIKYLRNDIRRKISKKNKKEIETLRSQIKLENSKRESTNIKEKKMLNECSDKNNMNYKTFSQYNLSDKVSILKLFLIGNELRFSNKFIYSAINQFEGRKSNVSLPICNKFLVKQYNTIMVKGSQYMNFRKVKFVVSAIEDNKNIIFSSKPFNGSSWFYMNTEDFPLTITNEYQGLKISLENNRHKKISRFYIDKKISIEERHKKFIIISKNNKIIAIDKIYHENKNKKNEKIFYKIVL